MKHFIHKLCTPSLHPISRMPYNLSKPPLICPVLLLCLASDTRKTINLDPLLLQTDIRRDDTTPGPGSSVRVQYFWDSRAYPIAPIAPSLRLAYPRFVAGIQKSKQSSVSWETNVARSLRVISQESERKRRGTYLSIARPCARRASWSSGPPFSAVLLRANRRPSARSRIMDAEEEIKLSTIPENQNRWEMVLIRANLLRRGVSEATGRREARTLLGFEGILRSGARRSCRSRGSPRSRVDERFEPVARRWTRRVPRWMIFCCIGSVNGLSTSERTHTGVLAAVTAV